MSYFFFFFFFFFWLLLLLLLLLFVEVLLVVVVVVTLLEFCTASLADGLSLEFEWQQVSWTLLSILAILNNAVVWMVSTRLSPLVTVLLLSLLLFLLLQQQQKLVWRKN